MRKIYKAKINGDLFIRVLNTNEKNELINISIYKKEENSYIKMYPTDLSIEIQNKLNSSDIYEVISDIDFINNFCDCIKKNVSKIKEINNFRNVDYVDIDIIYDTIYSFIKPKNSNDIYELNGLIVDKDNKIIGTKNISSVELPYILINILSKYKENNFIIHIYKDIYVRVEKMDNIIYVVAYEFSTKNNSTFLNINNIYVIYIKDNKINIVDNLEDKLLSKFKNKDYLNLISKEFLDKFDLAILNN